ncbi:hypothetical protein GCM10027416_05970 [Okibacterium endophyticum]
MKMLIREAHRLGLSVHAAHLPDDRLGLYVPSENRIYFDLDLTPSEQRSALAHELGHAYHGHVCDDARSERQADAWAAEMLVDPVAFAAAERINSDTHSIAEELNVTVKIIEDYRTYCLQRLGDRSYGRSMRGTLTNALARTLAP